ncbi:hypothetical protein SAMN05444515_103100 [Ectothiorhodospira marina]|uniref:Acyl carrier protein n=1 Tax=Ectothiorhodospira marina TaxID=1396821 RepID=A0A1H7IBX2_9GAMM|nr:hypothetical protein SAMN05444515_103100 [Ectothiorhodospira marina]
MLDDTLELKGRTARFDADTPLLGALPELDSLAVAWLIQGLEGRFGIQINDDCVDAEAFATVGTLTARVRDWLQKN